jgi:hypothetical protein
VVVRSDAPAGRARLLDGQHAAAPIGLDPSWPVRGHDPCGEIARIEVDGRAGDAGCLGFVEKADPPRTAAEIGSSERGPADVIAGHLEVDERFGAQVAQRGWQGGDLCGRDGARETTVRRERTGGDLGGDLEAHAMAGGRRGLSRKRSLMN